MVRVFGYLCIVTALGIGAYVVVRWYVPSNGPLVYSPIGVLDSTWGVYKRTYVTADYRTVDWQRGGVTTSEGQGYTMLRAVWEGDKPAFDGAWQWTEAHLARPSDHLFSWLWGKRADGVYGILTAENGQNTASDADTDIALSLVFAYARWQDPQYLTAARAIIRGIWEEEVVMINGKPYLAADNLEKTSSSPTIVVNPSYFSPAAYQIFAQVDPRDDWEALRTQSYALLEESMTEPLDATTSVQLPPDWMLVSRATGKVSSPSAALTGQSTPASSYDTNFGYDALRVPFRVALDWVWFGNPQAKALLSRMSFLTRVWEANHRLDAVYRHSGAPVARAESADMYGGTIGYFLIADPRDAQAVYRAKLLSLYNPTADSWIAPLSYYDANWAWLGIALYNGDLPNLTKDLPASAYAQP